MVQIIGMEPFIGFLGKMADETHKIVEDEVFKIASDFRNKIAQGMRDTPKNPKNKVRRTKSGLYHYRSYPGNYPAIDSGRLLGSIKVSKEEEGIMLGSIQKDPAYGLFLDQAKQEKRKRPWLIEPVGEMMKSANIESRIIDSLKRKL